MKGIKKKRRLLLPSLRERKRYLAFEIISESKIDDFELVSGEINSNLLNFMGEIGAAASGFRLLKDCWNKKEQKGVLMINDCHMPSAQAALALMEKTGNNTMIINSLGVSGILKKAKEKYITA